MKWAALILWGDQSLASDTRARSLGSQFAALVVASLGFGMLALWLPRRQAA